MANTIIQGSFPLSSSATGTTGAISATIGTTGATGRNVYCTGFTYQANGATAAATITLTLSYAPISGAAVTLGTWIYGVPAGATVIQGPLDINLIPPMNSNQGITGATNATTTTPVGSITLSASAAGAGETFAGLSLWGYMQ